MGKVPNNIYIKEIIPSFNNLLTTAEKYESAKTTNSGLILNTTKVEGSVKEYQIVLAIGTSVRNCKVGDLVRVNPARYAVYKQKKQNSITEDMAEHYKKELIGYTFNVLEVDGEETLMINDTDIEYVVSEYESLDAPQILVDTPTVLV